ncbi:endo-1,4-beta-xylanase [Paenibacillus daejeonensis]|uniref:endo-1,4-beta-xylanase n=1 Tax=Paenibacillus daejeonensis TaxID=135193 RepID=UPI00035E2747|nr:endo-1,4-beta-xylanase [Paenibacillus daejeonensis]
MLKGKTLFITISRILVVIMLLSSFAFAPGPAAAAEGEQTLERNKLIAQAEALKAGNKEFPLQTSRTNDGSDVNKAFPWVYADELQAFDNALAFARHASTPAGEAITSLKDAIATFTGKIKADGSDPYFRLDPGPGKVPVKVTAPTHAWTTRAPLDNRVPADFAGSTHKVIPYPFADSQGKSDVLQINYVHNGLSTFGGISLAAPLSPAVNVPAGATIEFDVYYPKSAQGKFMRWRVRNTNADLDSYLRGYEYNNLNPDWVGSYNGETWLKAHHSINASTGNSSNFILELHGENGRTAETGMLLVANIIITEPDPNGVALPSVVNKENQSVVAPLKSIYNRENDLFMVGAIGTGAVTGTRARHYEIFVNGNNLKADATHPRGPSWLKSVTGDTLSGATTTPGLGEYNFPTSSYQAIRDSGNPGEYKSHGHVLAWYNQAPTWMRQIIPANLPSGYTGTAQFYGLGNGVTSTVKVDKENARRVQFNHTMYVMRHFLTTDTKYGSSESRGIIPFNSWDVLNEEVHESRHSENIPADPNSWRASLKHTNWLVALTDDLIDGDIREHYVYQLFKYAHIAAPNAKMAAAYKANYADLPEFMKLDGHDTGGSIDAYITDSPPKLTYNDYDIASRTKARTAYNMIRALNTAWLTDPLYDGRPLIEDMGIQGHDAVKETLASDNQYAMALYASLVDEGLLSGIAFSEFDLKLPTSSPGGGAIAPAELNVRQSDALGYQYALMYKLFTQFAPYIDHIISWGVSGSGWQGSYVLFDGQSNANAGYYGAMNPDRFILGHSYLDDFFAGEYEKLQDGYVVDLGDLGTYTVGGPKSPAPVTLTGSDRVSAGGSFDLVYGLSKIQGSVLAQDVTVTYDTDKLELAAPPVSTDESKFIVVDYKTEPAGTLRILGVHLGEGQSNPNTNLIKLSFRAKEHAPAGPTHVEVTQLVTADSTGTETSHAGTVHTVQIGVVDRAALIDMIATAQADYNAAVEGHLPGQYTASAKQALLAAIQLAQQVADNTEATATQISEATAKLSQALQVFKAAVNVTDRGDLNNDGRYTVGDLALIAKHYGKTNTDPAWDSFKAVDVNGDGTIDLLDLVTVAKLILNS